ncbi:MAG TPA: helix-turn-helix domain-containing protein [Polyangiaceae bacterium]
MADRLLNVTEAAAMLGLKRSTLYQWAYERRIAHVKMGGALRFRLSAIEKLISKSEVPALKSTTEPVEN